jgi:hypothetical protein
MNCTLRSVVPFIDPENGETGFQVVVNRTRPGTPLCEKTEWVYATPKGEWSHEVTFSVDDQMYYTDFLDCMVHKNVSVLRKMCTLRLKSILDLSYPRDCIPLVHNVDILDPTFVPPEMNMSCKWQGEFAQHFCENFFIMVIETCNNYNRLDSLYRRLTTIDKKNYNYTHN